MGRLLNLFPLWQNRKGKSEHSDLLLGRLGFGALSRETALSIRVKESDERKQEVLTREVPLFPRECTAAQ